MRESDALRRDALTWLCYLLLFAFTLAQGVMGPALPFLRRDLSLDYQQARFYPTAFACGFVLAGWGGERWARLVGGRRAFWSAPLLLAASALGLAAAKHLLPSIACVALLGMAGSFTLATMQATLATHHGGQAGRATLEGNVSSSLGSALSPMVIAWTAEAPLGWRWVLIAPAAMVFVLAIGARTLALPDLQHRRGAAGVARRGMAFWAPWLALLFGVAAEWSGMFWGAEYLVQHLHFPAAKAALSMGAYLGGGIVARVFCARALRRRSSESLLVAWMLVALLAFFGLQWLPLPPMRLASMWLLGASLATVFPLSSATFLLRFPAQRTWAASRVSLGAGLAILTAPFLLGTAAHRRGLASAFWFIPLLTAFALAFSLVSLRSAHDASSTREEGAQEKGGRG